MSLKTKVITEMVQQGVYSTHQDCLILAGNNKWKYYTVGTVSLYVFNCLYGYNRIVKYQWDPSWVLVGNSCWKCYTIGIVMLNCCC